MTGADVIRVIRGADDRHHPGTWNYTVPAFGIKGRSRQPLLDACRQIKRMGRDPSHVAAQFREGREDWDIRCPVGIGAALTVEEPDKRRIRFRPFREFAGKAALPARIGGVETVTTPTPEAMP